MGEYVGLQYCKPGQLVFVISGGFQHTSSWSNITVPDVYDEIGNSMELDLVSGAWADPDGQIVDIGVAREAGFRYGHGLAPGKPSQACAHATTVA